MAEKLMKNPPDDDVYRLGKEVERFIREDANLDTTWIRSEGHFGNNKFSDFKNVR